AATRARRPGVRGPSGSPSSEKVYCVPAGGRDLDRGRRPLMPRQPRRYSIQPGGDGSNYWSRASRRDFYTPAEDSQLAPESRRQGESETANSGGSTQESPPLSDAGRAGSYRPRPYRGKARPPGAPHALRHRRAAPTR